MNRRLFLLVIFLFAVVIRLLGTNPGYPFTHPDEPSIYESVRKILIQKDTKPYTYYYGSLLPTIYSSADSFFLPIEYGKFLIKNFNSLTSNNFKNFSELWDSYLKNNHVIEFLSRYDTAVLSALTVVVIYLLGKELFTWRVGLISAFLTAVNYRLVLSSLLSLADAPSAFFVCLSLYFSYKLLKKPSTQNYILAAIGIALTLSVKYFIYTIPAFLLCHLFASINKFQKPAKIVKNILLSKNIWISLFTILTLFLLMNPYLIIDWQSASSQFAYNMARYGIPFHNSNNYNFLFSLKIKSFFPIIYLYKYGLGIVLSIITLLGYLLIFFRYPKQFLILASVLFPFLYFFLVISGTPAVRNYSPVIPLILLPSAVLIEWFILGLKRLTKIKQKVLNILLVASTLFLGSNSLFNSALLSYSLSKTRNLDATNIWINDNIPQKSKIIQAWQSPLPPRYSSAYWSPSIESFKSMEQISNSHYEWLIMNSEIPTYINGSYQTTNKETYISLITKEYADYRVKTFDKNFPLTIETSYFITKIPRLVRVADGSTIININSGNIKPCEQDLNKTLIGTHDANPLRFYSALSQVKVTTNENSSNRGEAFLRLDFFDSNNTLLSSHVSQLVISDDKKIQPLYLFGISPENTTYLKIFFQRDSCKDTSLKIISLNLSESKQVPFDLNSYPYYFSKLPDNFIWMPPL